MIAEDISRIPLPPCDRFGGCEHKLACARMLLACDDFAAYLGKPANKRKRVERGDHRRIPSRSVYDSLYTICDNMVRKRNTHANGGEGVFECGLTLIAGAEGAVYCPRCDKDELNKQWSGQ